MFRGIQIVGFVIALLAIAFILTARRKKRLSTRFFFFWVMFWGIFIVLDLYPSLAAFLTPALALESNMYVLIAGSILTLFVLVFALYSYLSDLNQKVTMLTREQAIANSRLAKLSGIMDRDEKKSSDSNTGS